LVTKNKYSVTRTKIIIPRRRDEILTRKRLLVLLNELLDLKLIIIAAPAGYGKTSLLIDFANHTQWPIVWLSLDTLDQDPFRFAAHLIAAIQNRFPSFGENSTSVLNNTPQDKLDLPSLVTTLVNDIYENIPEHFIFMLDDYQLVEESEAVNQLINRFVQNVDENCHLMVSSRRLLALADMPLLVARNQVGGDGTDTIAILGVDHLKACQHEIIPDRIEAGTFMIGAAITGGSVTIEECFPGHLTSLVEKLRLAGTDIATGDRSMTIRGPDRIQSVDVKTMPYPGFPTDLQAQFMTLMAVADGWSMIRETIFENRFIHVSELRRMGADIETNGSQALVKGKKQILSAPVMATDLRASASLVLAGLVAEGGRTEVHRIYHLDRGYEAIEEKFRGLGAAIWRESE